MNDFHAAAWIGVMGMANAIHKRERGVACLDNHPAYHRVPVTVVLHLDEVIPSDWEDGGQFFIEENHCLDNYVEAVHRRIEREPGYCQTCCSGRAYLGHVPFEAIEAGRSSDTTGEGEP